MWSFPGGCPWNRLWPFDQRLFMEMLWNVYIFFEAAAYPMSFHTWVGRYIVDNHTHIYISTNQYGQGRPCENEPIRISLLVMKAGIFGTWLLMFLFSPLRHSTGRIVFFSWFPSSRYGSTADFIIHDDAQNFDGWILGKHIPYDLELQFKLLTQWIGAFLRNNLSSNWCMNFEPYPTF